MRRVAVARGVKEGARDAIGLRRIHMVAGTGLLHVAARAHGQLAHGRRIAVERLRDLRQRHVEHVVQQEGGALQRREPFEREHQGEGQVVGDVLGRVDRAEQRLGQPTADIGLAPRPCRFHLVEA